MSNFSFDDNGDFEREIQFALNLKPKFNRNAKLIVRKVSQDAMRRIKIRMPVDTGRAQNDWGTSIYEVTDGGMTIEQGTKLGYVEYLNEGSSTQAPAGFIDAEAQRALENLANELGDDVEKVWRE